MVKVICDTSFLIHVANSRIKNLHSIETEIGQIQFVVPDVVIFELQKLAGVPDKKIQIDATLQLVKKFKTIKLGKKNADDTIISYVKKNRGIIATMDKNLKKEIKKAGGSVLSISNNKIILEN